MQKSLCMWNGSETEVKRCGFQTIIAIVSTILSFYMFPGMWWVYLLSMKKFERFSILFSEVSDVSFPRHESSDFSLEIPLMIFDPPNPLLLTPT